MDHFQGLYWVGYNIASALCFIFFGCEPCGSFTPWLGIEPGLPVLEGKVLTTGPPGKSPVILFFFFFLNIFDL